MRVLKPFSFLLAFSLFSFSASAQIPDDVMKAYKAYNSAMQSKDYKNAIKHARTAWQKAESTLGNNKLTGDLAYNYGYVEKNQGDKKKSISALERSADLASLHVNDAVYYRLEREVELIDSMEGESSKRDVEKRINIAKSFANSSGASNSIYFGELLVHETRICNYHLNRKIRYGTKTQTGSFINQGTTQDGIQKGQEKCGKIATKAIEIFEANQISARPKYKAIAYNYFGFAEETNRNWHKAAMSYQKARESVEDVYGRDHPLVAQSIGRWISARNYLRRLGRLESSESRGLCSDCWPLRSDGPKVRAENSVSPNFPARAKSRSSGYAVVQLDVSDAGKPENIKIFHSWPDDVYDKSSIKAVEQLIFPPKADNEPADFRKNITIPYVYTLTQGLDPI